jgi:hypothetical protein
LKQEQNPLAFAMGETQLPFYRDHETFFDSHAYHDLSYWEAVHPDWILYKCDRVTPAYEFDNPNMPLDFANPALESWQIQTYAMPPHAGLVLLTGP